MFVYCLFWVFVMLLYCLQSITFAGPVLAENFRGRELAPGSCRPLSASKYNYVTYATIMSLQGHHCLLIELKLYNLTTCIQWCGLRLRPSVLGQDRSETKKIDLGLGLAGLMLRCERRSCHARRHNDLEGHSNLSIFGSSLAVEINSGVHLSLLKS